MALWSVAGGASSAGMADSRKRSTSCRFCSRYCLMSIRRRRVTKHPKGVNAKHWSWNRCQVQVERDFSAGPREDGELGLRERIEVAVCEGRDHLGAISRGFRPGGRAVGRVVRPDSHRHDLPVALDEHDEGVLREVTAVTVWRGAALVEFVIPDTPGLLVVWRLGYACGEEAPDRLPR